MESIVNPLSLKGLLALEPAFQTVLDLYGTPPNWRRLCSFDSLVKIILEQQISLQSAHAHYMKLATYLGNNGNSISYVIVNRVKQSQDDTGRHASHSMTVTPESLITLTDQEMRACQISRQKMVYLREVAQATLDGRLDFRELHKVSIAEAKQTLINIKGVGEWSAQVFAIFCLQAPDEFPAGDIAVINSAKDLFGLATREEVIKQSHSWSPYRTLATFLLWYYYLKKRNRSTELL